MSNLELSKIIIATIWSALPHFLQILSYCMIAPWRVAQVRWSGWHIVTHSQLRKSKSMVSGRYGRHVIIMVQVWIQWWASISTILVAMLTIFASWDVLLLLLPIQLEYQSHVQIMVIPVTTYLIDQIRWVTSINVLSRTKDGWKYSIQVTGSPYSMAGCSEQLASRWK